MTERLRALISWGDMDVLRGELRLLYEVGGMSTQDLSNLCNLSRRQVAKQLALAETNMRSVGARPRRQVVPQLVQSRPPDGRRRPPPPLLPIVDDDARKKWRLSPREAEVLSWAALGLDNNEICDALNINVETVTSHITGTLAKLRASNRATAVYMACMLGIFRNPYQDADDHGNHTSQERR